MAMSNGDDMYTAGISFNLPLQLGKRRAMVNEAQQEKRMAEAEADGLRHEIHRRIRDALAKLESSAAMAQLYREGLLPQSEFARESTLASYRAGKAEFMAVLDSQMKLFGDEQKYAGFVAEHQMLRAQLEATVGTKLP
jgi:outer membrane protein TolC